MSSNSLQTSSALGPDPAARQSLVITTTDYADFHFNNRPTLPVELVSKIILELQQDRLYAVLAKMAQVNSTFYDLVIPKLYETVTITAGNKYRMYYDSHASQYHDDLPYNSTKTRKDRAIEWCRRVIIDTPTWNFADSVEYIAELLPHHRYGNVEELVFTRRAMGDSGYKEDTWWLCKILNPIARIGIREGIHDQLPKTKRVVMHLSDHYRWHWMIRPLSQWCRQRRNVRKPTQFAIHNLQFGTPRYIFDHMSVDCYFSRYADPPSDFHRELLLWLLDQFGNADTTGWPKLNLFDGYCFLMANEDALHDPIRTSQQARSMIESHLDAIFNKAILNGKVEPPPDKAQRLREIMARIAFFKAEHEEEYPTSRPSTVAQLETVASDQDQKAKDSDSGTDTDSDDD